VTGAIAAWKVIADTRTPDPRACIGCGRKDDLELGRVWHGEASAIVASCSMCRPYARGHWLDWLDYWRRKRDG